MLINNGQVYFTAEEYNAIRQRYPGERKFSTVGEHVLLKTENNTFRFHANFMENGDITIFNNEKTTQEQEYMVSIEINDLIHPFTINFKCTSSKITSDLSNLTGTVENMYMAEEYIKIEDGYLNIKPLRYKYTANGQDYVEKILLENTALTVHEDKPIEYDRPPAYKIVPVAGNAFFLDNNPDEEPLVPGNKIIDLSHKITIMKLTE